VKRKEDNVEPKTIEEYQKIKDTYSSEKINKMDKKKKRKVLFFYTITGIVLSLAIVVGSLYIFNEKSDKFTYLVKQIGNSESEVIKNASCSTDVSGNHFCLLADGNKIHVKQYQIIMPNFIKK